MEVPAHLDAEDGDKLTLVRTAHGIELSKTDPDFDDQTAAAKEIMAKRQRALRALADALQDEDREILRELAKK